MDLAHILYYLSVEKENKKYSKQDRDKYQDQYRILTHIRTLKGMHFLADLSLIYKMMDLLFQMNDNSLSSLTNSKSEIEKEIKHLMENKGEFEKTLSELIRKEGDNYYYYKHLLSTKGQYSLRSYKNIKSFDNVRITNLNKAWDRIQHRVYNKNEIEPKTKSVLFINWISMKNNKNEIFVIDEYKIKDVKYLCRVFYRDFDKTWKSIQCLKRFIFETFDLLSVPVGLIDCIEMATVLRGEEIYQDAIRLYWDLYSIGIHAMWIERFNKKASILTGDKHKINTSVKKMNWMININEEGPDFQHYDIRIPILRMAYSAKPKDVTLETAMKQPWCRGLFTAASEKERKNKHFDNTMQKWLQLKPKK